MRNKIPLYYRFLENSPDPDGSLMLIFVFHNHAGESRCTSPCLVMLEASTGEAEASQGGVASSPSLMHNQARI
jgi:hypothetical protein